MTRTLIEALRDATLDWLAAGLAPRLAPPPRPGPFRLTFARARDMIGVYRLGLPALSTRVALAYLALTIDGVSQEPIEVVDGQEVEIPIGSAVVAVVYGESAAGVRSDPSDPLSFTAVDETKPETPGAPTLTFVRVKDDGESAES